MNEQLEKLLELIKKCDFPVGIEECAGHRDEYKSLKSEIEQALKLWELVEEHLKKYDKDKHNVYYCAIETLQSLIEEAKK